MKVCGTSEPRKDPLRNLQTLYITVIEFAPRRNDSVHNDFTQQPACKSREQQQLSRRGGWGGSVGGSHLSDQRPVYPNMESLNNCHDLFHKGGCKLAAFAAAINRNSQKKKIRKYLGEVSDVYFFPPLFKREEITSLW